MTTKEIKSLRIGVEIGPYDPFWVEVREVVCRLLEDAGVTLIRLEIAEANSMLFNMNLPTLVDELLALELDALITVNLPQDAAITLVENQLPIISVSESIPRHQLLCCLTGLYEAGKMGAEFIVERLGGKGCVVGVGGLVDLGDDKGQSRIRAARDVFSQYPDIQLEWVPSAWEHNFAYDQIYQALSQIHRPIDAVLGLSDTLALAARDVLKFQGRADPKRLIVGINGDPLALAGIVDGSIAATIETPAAELARQAVENALLAGQRLPFSRHFFIPAYLITRDNVADIALRKLVGIADLPTKLVGLNHEKEANRLRQLEGSSEVNRRVGVLLDRRQLAHELVELVRFHYGYDLVQVYFWSKENQMLIQEGVEPHRETRYIPFDQAGILKDCIQTQEPISVPDLVHSQRYHVDAVYPDTRTRVAIPLRLGEEIVGVLDLHRKQPNHDVRQELVGLQSMADQLVIAMRNAELYSEAIKAREQAEKADQLKTRLLANVSHELRAPLNVILGYSKSALQEPNPYHTPLPAELLRDLKYIYQGGEHLLRIINDLLDVSRAEIGELCLFPELLDLRPFLVETFTAFSQSANENARLEWVLDLPPTMPVILADPARLRQILLNLLSNAARYTPAGKVTLGADVEPPYVHFWVADTGPGIPVEQQERIFEPFVSIAHSSRRPEGIGLGLSITRYLIALHHGALSLESQPGHGSAFHFYLPLPNMTQHSNLSLKSGSESRSLYVVTAQETPSPAIQAIAARRRLGVSVIHSFDDLARVAEMKQPATLAWDMTQASAAEWQIIQSIQAHPEFQHLPFILFKSEDSTDLIGAAGLTSVLLKPLQRQSLGDLLKGLRDTDHSGVALVVDDDPQARNLYCQIIAEALPDHRAVSVGNGKLALEAIEREIPAFVILDLMMPEMDGFTLLDHLRSDPRTLRLPVVVISGKKLTFEEVQRLDYARVTYQTKGLLTPDEMVLALRQTSEDKDLLGQPTSRLVKYALVYMQQHFSQAITRKELADAVGVSESYLSKIFRQELGVSPWEALTRLRVQTAKELLLTTDATVTRVALMVGFNDSAYFCRVFHKSVGLSPQEFRQK